MRCLVFIGLLLLAGCRTGRLVYGPAREVRDTVWREREARDSEREARDSVRETRTWHEARTWHEGRYDRDSIYVVERGDTVTRYVERWRTVWRERRDTVWRERWRRDTVRVATRDSVTVVQAAKAGGGRSPWWKRALQAAGMIALAMAAGYFMYPLRRG